MSLHLISHFDLSLLIIVGRAQETCKGCDGMYFILCTYFATQISFLSITGNIDNSWLIDVVQVDLGTPRIRRIPWF